MDKILNTDDIIKVGDFVYSSTLGKIFFESKDLAGCCDRVKLDYPLIFRSVQKGD